MSYPRWIYDPISGSNRTLNFLSYDSYHSEFYAVLSLNQSADPTTYARAAAILDPTTQAVTLAKNIDWDGTGTYPKPDFATPIIRPPTGSNIYTAFANTGSGSVTGTSFYFTSLDLSLDHVQHSQTPSDTSYAGGLSCQGYPTGCVAGFGNTQSLFSNQDGSVVGFYDGFNLALWDTVNNRVSYMDTASLGYTVGCSGGAPAYNQRPAAWCFDGSGALWVLVCGLNTPRGGLSPNPDNTLDQWAVTLGLSGPTLSKTSSTVFASDSANNYVGRGLFYRPVDNQLFAFCNVVALSGGNTIQNLYKFSVGSNKLVATYDFGLNIDDTGNSWSTGAFAAVFPLGLSGTWSNIKNLAMVWRNSPSVSPDTSGLLLMDLTSGAITTYSIDLWPTDGAGPPNLFLGDVVYDPVTNTIWTSRANQFIENMDGTYTYEGLGIYGFPSVSGYYIERLTQVFDDNVPDAQHFTVDSGIVPPSAKLATSGSEGFNGIRCYGMDLLTVSGATTLAGVLGGMDIGDSRSAVFGVVDFAFSGNFTLAYVQSFGTKTFPEVSLDRYQVAIDSGTTNGFGQRFYHVIPLIVGFPYTSQAQLLRPNHGEDAGTKDGPAMGKIRRNHKYAALLYRTQGDLKFGTDFATTLHPAPLSQPNGAAIAQPTLFSGTIRDTIADDYSTDGMIAFQQTRPGPGTIISIAGHIETQDE